MIQKTLTQFVNTVNEVFSSKLLSRILGGAKNDALHAALSGRYWIYSI